MLKKRDLFVGVLLVVLVLCLVPMPVWAATPPEPVVAIHVSEYSQAVDATGGWWHYFVMHESLKEALDSDGTPSVEVTDADVSAGVLLYPDGSPRYPIVISLASEAIHDDEVDALRDYVAAGGFLLVGSSAFTRNPDGTARGDFALADEMGLHSAGAWYQNRLFNKVMDHRLASGIPEGALTWLMAPRAGSSGSGNHYAWQVSAGDADVIADGSSGPLLATNSYGNGYFIYHGALQPLIGHGGYGADTYAYLIYRNAIEWAFEVANLPIIKLSPWRYEHDAAYVIRKDYENWVPEIQSIEASSQLADSVGAKSDYYFCTGTARVGSEDDQLTDLEKQELIASLQRAVSLYGATIGSHNGGLPNPVGSYQPTDYGYWHWGPDRALGTNPPGYDSGYEYAYTSILTSFLDIEGWMTGLDNGRPACGAAGNCPRTWVSPNFRSVYEDSREILEELDAITMGEQNIGPFPHWSLSYETSGDRYAHVVLPTSEWYIGSSVAQSLEFGAHHTVSTVREAMDFYYDLGALINIYGHRASTSGVHQEYIMYTTTKPRLWKTNAVGIYDWWVLRSGVDVTPSYTRMGPVAVAGATVSGAVDPETAVEMVIPHWDSGAITDLQVFLDGVEANPTDYRTTGYGVKVNVGDSVSDVEVRYRPLEGWVQTDWDGGPGQTQWADETMYESATGMDDSVDGQLRLSLTSGEDALFSDDFTRPPDPPDPLAPWALESGTWSVADGILRAEGGSGYSYVYTSTNPLWTDYTVEGRIQFPAGAFGGGIGGRVDPDTGAHYGAWVYPDGSSGGSNVLKLIKFHDWTTWSHTPMQQVDLPGSVGADWHTLKLEFEGNHIVVTYDGAEVIDVTDNNYDGMPAYVSGGISVDTWGSGGMYKIAADDVLVRPPIEYSSSGTLLSSAFDGGMGVQWQNIAWNATTGGSTNVRLRTRTAEQADQLSSASWSDWYTASGSPVASEDRRWIQYQVELTTGDTEITPVLYEIGITYVAGPGVHLNYTGPSVGDSESSVALSATLLDDENGPVVGRTVDFTVDGLSTVSGVTDAGGEASASVDLMIAPGPYSVTVAFAGDEDFGPVSVDVPFEVTSPWSEWVQDTQADFESGALTNVDAVAQPGSVRLEDILMGEGEEAGTFTLGEGEESGSFTVGGVPGWSYRHRVLIDNNAPEELPEGYSVKLVLDTETLVSEGKLRPDGDDLRVVWDDGGTSVELDRVAETAFNAPDTEVWFQTQAAIPGGGRDGSYHIYYGNPEASAPPADPAEVYALWDDFDGDTLDTSVWETSGAVTVSDGQAHIPARTYMLSRQAHVYALLEMRLQPGGENEIVFWGWEETPVNAPNLLVFQEQRPSRGLEAIYRSGGGGWHFTPVDDPPGGLPVWHTYAFDWWSGNARWLIDGEEVASTTSDVPSSAMKANFYAYRSVPIDVDWVKARLRVAQEPSVSLSRLEVFDYRRRVFIDNNVAEELPEGYAVKSVLDTAALVSEGKLRPDGDDLRVVWDDGGAPVELDRVAETAFNAPDTEVWFQTQADIPGNGRDGSYHIYYGNPAADAPPADPAEIYALWDDFDGGALDTSVWESSGSVSVSDGQAHLGTGANIISTRFYTHTLLEARLQPEEADNIVFWGWEETPINAPNLIVFQEQSPPNGLEGLIGKDGGAWDHLPMDDPPGGLATWHTYTIDWWAGNVRWLIDDAEVESTVDKVPETGTRANFNAYQIPMHIDWIKARPRVAQEPTVSLATHWWEYTSPGQILSVPYDTAQFSAWKYLTWEATTPLSTGVGLRLRTAATAEGLSAAPWVEYGESGLPINNDAGRWVQYEATLNSTDPYTTPALHKVTVYYTGHPATLTVGLSPETVLAGEASTCTASVDDGEHTWDVTGETDFSIVEGGHGGAWASNVYTSAVAGEWTVQGEYAGLNGTGSLHVDPVANLSVVKTSSAAVVSVGSPLTYTVTVTNEGPSAAGGVTVTDELPAGMSLVSATSSGGSCSGTDTVVCGLGDLVPGADASATLVVTVTGAGQITNTAVASGEDVYGNPVSGTGAVSVDVVAPVIAIEKEGPAAAQIGDTAVYTFTVSNDAVNGDGTAISGVSVSDDVAGDASYVDGDVGDDGVLEVGETWVFTASHTIGLGDPDPLVNVGTAVGEGLGGGTVRATDTHSTGLGFVPVLDIEKEGPATAQVGETVVYTFTVTNDAVAGDGSPVSDVGVSDDVAGDASYVSGDDGADGVLEVGETWVFTASHTIGLEDPDPLVNTGTAVGQDLDGGTVRATDTHSTGLGFAPVLDIEKEGPATAQVGETVVYTFTVINDAVTGDGSPVSDVDVSDDVAGDATYVGGDDGADGVLEVGETWVFTASYMILEGDPNPLVNVGTVTGRDRDGAAVSASDTHSTAIGQPAPTPGIVFLPVVTVGSRGETLAPDLVVERITVTDDSAQVVIKNQGPGPVTAGMPFWVDLYVNPHPVPTMVNQTWDMLCSEGMVWGVRGTALPLEPGEELTLTNGDAYYWSEYSTFSGAFAEVMPIYVQVDSANADTTHGAVLESHEIAGGTYNNISGPVYPTSGASGATVTTESPDVGDAPRTHDQRPPGSFHRLPPRP